MSCLTVKGVEIHIGDRFREPNDGRRTAILGVVCWNPHRPDSTVCCRVHDGAVNVDGHPPVGKGALVYYPRWMVAQLLMAARLQEYLDPRTGAAATLPASDRAAR